MNSISSRAVEQNVLAMSISETTRRSQHRSRGLSGYDTYPSTNPTIEMTAAVREYARRARCHAEGSGKFSKNQSWNTGGNLCASNSGQLEFEREERQKDLRRENLFFESFSSFLRMVSNRVEDLLEFGRLYDDTRSVESVNG